MNHLDIHAVVQKLIGPVDPIGETHTDNDNLANLKNLTELTDYLLRTITHVSRRNKDSYEHSRKVAGEHAHNFLRSMRDEIGENISQSTICKHCDKPVKCLTNFVIDDGGYIVHIECHINHKVVT